MFVKIRLLILCVGLYTSPLLLATIPMALSDNVRDIMQKNPSLFTLTNAKVFKDEKHVLNAYLSGKVKLSIIRADMLIELSQHPLTKGIRSYHILAKLSSKSILYFGTNGKHSLTKREDFKEKTVSIGLLGDDANQYFKKMLTEGQLAYDTHFISLGAYRSLSLLKKDKIQAMVSFVSERYLHDYKQYFRPYPERLKEILEQEESLTCEQEYCYASYYLIASDTLGSKVMQNLYAKMDTILDSNKVLNPKFGKYYINTQLKNPETKIEYRRVVVNKEAQKIAAYFHRAPWMDLAIDEAIKGKGSAENVLPMLDLSYKYIRFSKGKSGITTAPNDSVEGSWCAAYICWTLDKSGYTIHPKGRMASQSFRYFNNQLYKKISTPIFGAITLYTNVKNPGHGHVGYLFGTTPSGKYILLGGNQSNRLKFTAYPRYFGGNKIKGFYVPISYKISQRDWLTKKDVYRSANILNRRYGIVISGQDYGVR